jgi:phage tail tape-measure protein
VDAAVGSSKAAAVGAAFLSAVVGAVIGSAVGAVVVSAIGAAIDSALGASQWAQCISEHGSRFSKNELGRRMLSHGRSSGAVVDSAVDAEVD